MSLSIKEPACLNEIGGRENNEDSIFPNKEQATKNDKLFIVCDGVGGSHYGEVASKLACEALADYIMFEEKFNPQKAISFIELRFSDYFDLMPQYYGMATTMVFLLLNNNNTALIGWIGDSRAYYIRQGQILFQTEDHSLVTELVKKGLLNSEEAKYDYRKNIITRSINGPDNHTEIDYKIIENIQSNDYFLLCSDGLLEIIDNNFIEKYFNGVNDPQKIKNNIYHLCEGNTNDNYSMYIIQVE